MKTFSDILNRPAPSIEKPKPRPLGTYFASVAGIPKQKTVSGDILILEYWFKCTGAKALNDPETDPGDISSWAPIQKAFFLNSEEAEYAHRQFLINALGINPGTDSDPKSVGEMVGEAPGRQCLVTLKHRPYVDANGEPQLATDVGAVAKV